jgi:rfaE bifunctional protein nucleotidyltransferase chain/domain
MAKPLTPAEIIVDHTRLSVKTRQASESGGKIVLANGCFDLLHVGHVRLLQDAARKGDVLIVALNTDESVRRFKGPERPIVTLDERMEIIASLSGVDFVTCFAEATVDNLLLLLKPNFLAKGTEYTPETIPEAATVESYGGRIVICGDPKTHSTTSLADQVVRSSKTGELVGRAAERKFPMGTSIERPPDEWAKIEAAEHDEYYAHAYPFGLNTYEFTVEHALWYEDYAYKRGRRKDRGHRTRKFLELVDLDTVSGKRVLDIGCGIGQYSVLCAKMGGNATGIELSPIAVGIAQEIATANNVRDRCQFVAGEFTQMSFPDEHFDIVMLHEVLHHAIKYPGVKEEILRITKPGGKVVVADTLRGSLVVNLGRKLTKHMRHRKDHSLKEHEENLGDVLFGLETYQEFAKGFSSHKIFLMSYLYMIKQMGLQHHVNKFYVRWFLRLVKYSDDVLLTILPFLRRGCGEGILCAIK